MKNYFVSNLKYIREQKNISQSKLAKLINVNQTTIARWEDENRIPSIDKAIDVSNALKIPLNELVGIDLRVNNKDLKQSKFHHTSKELGLSVEIIPTNDINWNNLSKEEQEQYINQAMDALYEAKKEIKNNK